MTSPGRAFGSGTERESKPKENEEATPGRRSRGSCHLGSPEELRQRKLTRLLGAPLFF
jgi:hypothetical protein